MAENVQAVLDQMVPALKDLLDKGVFSQSEMSAIVERRRKYEYLLRRKETRKADFLRYIEDELSLDRLRLLRMKKLRTQFIQSERRRRRQKQKQKQNEKNDDDNLQEQQQEEEQEQEQEQNYRRKRLFRHSIGDSSIVRHIHFIFIRAIRKWKEDITLHLQHAEFAKRSGSVQRLGKIYAQALQLHPRNVNLWIEAASHEFFGYNNNNSNTPQSNNNDDNNPTSPTTTNTISGSIQSARILLQRGLRINPKSQDLWLQYFTLECHYIQKIIGRTQILLSSNNADNDDDVAMEDESNLNNNNNNNLKELLAIPKIIYNNAIQSIPEEENNNNNNITFRLKFIDQCHLFPNSTISILMDYIWSSIYKDFKFCPKAWIIRAKHVWDDINNNNNKSSLSIIMTTPTHHEKNDDNDDDDNDNDDDNSNNNDNATTTKEDDDIVSLKKCFDILEEAITTIPTPIMYLHCIQFIQCLQNEEVNNNNNNNISKQLDTYLHHLFTKSNENNIISFNLILEHVQYLINIGDLIQANDIMKQALLSSSSSSSCSSFTMNQKAKLWIKRAQLVQAMELSELNKTKKDSSSNEAAAANILRMALEHDIPMSSSKEHLDVLLSLFRLIMNDHPSEHANKKNKKKKKEKELCSLYQRLILLSSSSFTTSPTTLEKDNSNDDDDNDNDDEQQRMTHLLLNTILMYFKYIISRRRNEEENNDNNKNNNLYCLRQSYKELLFHSSFLNTMKKQIIKNNNNNDIDNGVASLFLFCIMSEEQQKQKKDDNDNDSQKHASRLLNKAIDLLNKAIDFFHDIGNIEKENEFRKKKTKLTT